MAEITNYRDKITWDLTFTGGVDKNVTSYFALPQVPGQYGNEYCLETAPPVPVYDLSAANITSDSMNSLLTDFKTLNAVFTLITNTNRTIKGRALSLSYQEIAGTLNYSCSIRLKSVQEEASTGENTVNYSYTRDPQSI